MLDRSPSLSAHTPAAPDDAALLGWARAVLAIEARAIDTLGARLDHTFGEACRLLLACRGKVVVLGMGKSGHIARKVAATLASTGTPAFFMHPAEAAHGDLGMLCADDVVFALSHSGETAEILALLPAIKRWGVPLIGCSRDAQSSLGRAADLHLTVTVEREACPLNLAPTASTTATLALGDALALCLLQARGFSVEDFARSHPGGSLGRRLLVRVRDVMHIGDALPRVSPEASVHDALFEITRKGLGITSVVDAEGRLLGIFTDGDLRRQLDRHIDLRTTPIAQVMSRQPKTIGADQLASVAAQRMEQAQIYALLVVEGEIGSEPSAPPRLVGALRMHDLLRAGVI